MHSYIVRFIHVLAGYIGGTLGVRFKRDFILTVFTLTGLFQYSFLWSLDWGFQRGSHKAEFYIYRVHVNKIPQYVYYIYNCIIMINRLYRLLQKIK